MQKPVQLIQQTVFRFLRVVVVVILLAAISIVFRSALTAPVHAQGDCDLTSSALIGTLSEGINCIGDEGFSEYEFEIGGLPASSINDSSVCPDSGALVLLNIFGLALIEDGDWSEIEVPMEVSAPRAVACGLDGEIWLGFIGGLAQYNGEWTTYAKEAFGSSPFIIGVDDVAAGADGSVWALTSGSVSRFNDGEWEVFENGSGFDQDYSFSAITVNSDGLPTVAHSSGILTFDGEDWDNEDSPIGIVNNLLIDNDNRVWVGTFGEGLAVFDDGDWTTYTLDDGLGSNTINAIASDQQGRIWVGTAWGLNVLDGDEWVVYQMGNSALLDNNVQHIIVGGEGPALPDAEDKEPGSIIGVVEDGRDPAPDLRIELCTEPIGGVFYGETPCEGQPGQRLTTTDENGEFAFEDVPAGRYDVTIETPDGWVYFIGIDAKVIVEPGEVTDLDDIDISD